MRTYLAVLRGTLMAEMAYRASFIFVFLGNLLYLCVAYFLWRSIYQNTETIHGLSFNDTFIYVGLGSTIFVMLKTYADWQIAHDIGDGSISIYLSKPVDYELYSLSTSLGSALMTLIVISIPALIMMVLIFKVTFTLGPGLLLFPVSLALAFVIGFCFDYITGLMSFYTESIWGISTSKEILISILAGALVPLQFFPDNIQNILRVLPFQAIYFTPLMMVTRPNQDWGTLFSALGVQAFWVVILFIVTRLFYNQAIKVLRVAGG